MKNPVQGVGSGVFRALLAQPYLLLVLAPTLWGGNIVGGKLAVGHVDPYLLLLGRWLGAVLILLPFALPHVRNDWQKIVGSFWWLALYGVLGFAAFNMLMYGAAHFTAAINASIEQAVIPVIVFAGNFIVFRVRARLLQMFGLVLTVLGVVWVATHGEPGRILSLSVNVGDGMVLLACLFYATYSLTLRYKPAIHWLSFIFVTAFLALIASLGFLFAFGGGIGTLIETLPQTTPIGWALVFYVMIFPSIIAQLAYARGLEIIGPNRASIFINLIPITGTILAIILVGENVALFHLIAVLLVVSGIGLSEYAVRMKR